MRVVDASLRDTCYNKIVSPFVEQQTNNPERYSRNEQRKRRRHKEHMYAIAKCKTNIHGIQEINYVAAGANTNQLFLYLSCRNTLPNFKLAIKNDSFSVVDEYYPFCGRAGWYETKTRKQELTLDKRKYEPDDTIFGYINYHFDRIYHSASQTDSVYTYFFTGYFSAIVDAASDKPHKKRKRDH